MFDRQDVVLYGYLVQQGPKKNPDKTQLSGFVDFEGLTVEVRVMFGRFRPNLRKRGDHLSTMHRPWYSQRSDVQQR